MKGVKKEDPFETYHQKVSSFLKKRDQAKPGHNGGATPVAIRPLNMDLTATNCFP
jgi:hypothetical protein